MRRALAWLATAVPLLGGTAVFVTPPGLVPMLGVGVGTILWSVWGRVDGVVGRLARWSGLWLVAALIVWTDVPGAPAFVGDARPVAVGCVVVWAAAWWTVLVAHLCQDNPPRLHWPRRRPRPARRKRHRTPAGVAPDLSRLPVATTEDGRSWSIPFQGGHVLVVGESGAGKGSVEWSIVEQLAPRIRAGLVRVVAIDPKVLELGRGRELWDEWIPGRGDWTVRVADVLEREVDAMNRRGDSMLERFADKHEATVDEPLTLVFIDELVRVTRTVPDRDVRRRIENALLDLLSNGRAPGWVVVACTQEPAQSVVGVVRDFFPVRVCLRVASAVDVDMTLGSEARTQHGADAHMIDPDNEQGVGYVWSEGRKGVERVRFNYLDTPAIRALVDDPRPGPDPVTTAEPATLVDLVEVAWTPGEDVMHMDELAAAAGRSQAELKSALTDAGLTVIEKVKKKRGDTWTPKNGIRRRDFEAWRDTKRARNVVSTA